MKTILTSSFVLLTCFAAFAAPSYWAAINTAAYTKDKTPSTANVNGYQAYYCTAKAAQDMFGGADTVKGIENYLNANFANGKAAMGKTEGSFAIDESGYYEDGQYTFIERFAAAVADDSYFAVAFYGNSAFRVFGSDNAVLDSGTLTFDDATGGTVGAWTATGGGDVPEPTSGMLLLLGSALLALRRKSK